MNKQHSIFFGGLAVLIFIGAFFLLRQQPITPETPAAHAPFSMKVGFLPLPQPILVAKEKGFFDEEGLDVELVKFPNANAALEAIARSEVVGNGAIAYFTLFSFELKSPNALVATFSAFETKDAAWSQLIIKQDRGIETPEDLEGKTIVMRTGLSSKLQADAVLKGIGIDPSRVHYEQVNPDLIVPTFSSPSVDAYLDIQPHATILIEQRLGTSLVDHPRADFIMDPYPLAAGVLSARFVEYYPDEARRFVRAMEHAIEHIKTNEADARAVFEKTLGLEPNVATRMPLFENKTLGETNPSNIAALTAWAVEYGLLEKEPDLTTFFSLR